MLYPKIRKVCLSTQIQYYPKVKNTVSSISPKPNLQNILNMLCKE